MGAGTLDASSARGSGSVSLWANSGLTLAAGSLTSVSGLGSTVPFGQTTGGIDWTVGAGTGNALSHKVDLESSPDFVRLLAGPDAPAWDGVLLSVGGNDLIAAARTPALNWNGDPIPLELRLLRRQTEWGPPSAGVARYFSEPGWATYAEYLRANVKHLLSLRDQGPSHGKPVFMHRPRDEGRSAEGDGGGGFIVLLGGIEASAAHPRRVGVNARSISCQQHGDRPGFSRCQRAQHDRGLIAGLLHGPLLRRGGDKC